MPTPPNDSHNPDPPPKIKIEPVDNSVSLDWRKHSIAELDLSTRSFNALQRLNVNKLGLLADMLESEEQFLALRNVGSKTMAEIKEKLQAYRSNVRSASNVVPKQYPAWYSYPIRQLKLSSRVRHPLERSEYKTIGQLALLIEKPVPAIDGIGKQGIMEIRSALSEFLANFSQSAFESKESNTIESNLNETGEANNISLQERVTEYLSILSEKDRQIVAWRYG